MKYVFIMKDQSFFPCYKILTTHVRCRDMPAVYHNRPQFILITIDIFSLIYDFLLFQEKLLQTFDDNSLTKEHKMLKKMVHPSSINHGDKKKFKSSKKRKRSAIVETSMAGDRSSSDSDPDSKSKKFKNNEGEFIFRYV